MSLTSLSECNLFLSMLIFSSPAVGAVGQVRVTWMGCLVSLDFSLFPSLNTASLNAASLNTASPNTASLSLSMLIFLESCNWCSVSGGCDRIGIG